MIEWNDQLRQELAAAAGSPLRFTDPQTKKEYIVLQAEIYDQVRDLLGDFQPSIAYPAIDRAFAPGWNDPIMDDYDRYEEFKK